MLAYETMAGMKLAATVRPLVALGFGGVIPLLLYNAEWTSAAIVIGVCSAYSGVRFGWTCFGRTPDLMAGFFWMFMYIFAGLAPLVQLAGHQWPLGTGITDAQALAAAVVMLVFLLAFDVGRGFARRAKPSGPPDRELNPGRLLPVVVFAFLASAYELFRIGSVGVLFDSRRALNRAISSGSAPSLIPPLIHLVLLGLPMFIGAYLLIAASKTGRIGPRPLATLLTVAATLILINPISSARYAFGTVALGLLLVALLPLKMTIYRCLMLGTSSVIIFAFQVFSLYRYEDSAGSVGVRLDPYAQLRHGDYDAFQQAAHAIEWVQATGFHPQQLLGPLVFWVPRVWWPDKPYDTGIVVAEFIGLVNNNLSEPIPAEMYVAGGWLLVALSGLLLGYAWRRMDQRLALFGPTGFIGLVVPILAAYQFILLRGSLLQAMARLTVILALLWFATSPVSRGETRPANGKPADPARAPHSAEPGSLIKNGAHEGQPSLKPRHRPKPAVIDAAADTGRDT